MTDSKVQVLTDVGSPLKVTSPLENIILLVMAMAVIAVLILFCTTPISRKVMVQGQLSSSTYASPLYAAQSGLVANVLVKKGDEVKKGDLLMELSAETVTGANVKLVAENDGIVTQVAVERNHSVLQHQPLVFLSPMKQDWELELYLPSTAIGSLIQGDTMDVRFDALPSRIYGSQPAIVKSISAIPVSTNEIQYLMLNPAESYYRVNLKLREGCSMPKSSCDKWRLGMRLNSIVVTEKTVFIDRLLKPIIAR
jgi:multidrug resistance efflux pump